MRQRNIKSGSQIEVAGISFAIIIQIIKTTNNRTIAQVEPISAILLTRSPKNGIHGIIFEQNLIAFGIGNIVIVDIDITTFQQYSIYILIHTHCEVILFGERIGSIG